MAEKTGLSLRTIQRIESGETTLKGHSLNVLSNFLKQPPPYLLCTHQPDPLPTLKLMNLSVLFCILFPLLHVLFPTAIWYRKRRKHPDIDRLGRQIIGFQILWSGSYIITVVITAFVQASQEIQTPIILFVMLFWVVINLFVVGKSAVRLSANKFDLFNSRLQFL